MAYSVVYVESGEAKSGSYLGEQNWLIVSSGGTAVDTKVGSRGHLLVYEGGKSYIASAKGNAGIQVAGLAYSNTVDSHGELSISSGGTAGYNVVNSLGHIVVFDGAAFFNTINDGGSLDITSGGTASYNTINSGGSMKVYDGLANSTTVSSGGKVWVSSGCVVNFTTLSSGGNMVISAGATANYTSIFDQAVLTLQDSATLNNTTLSSGGSMFLDQQNQVANSTTVSTGGTFRISSGGTANNTILEAGGSFTLFSGGTVNIIKVQENAEMIVSGGTVTSATVYQNAMLLVSYGGTVSNTTIIGGSLDLINEALPISAVSTTLTGGTMYVRRGAKATATSAYNGEIKLGWSGTMTDTVVSGVDGSMFVYESGVASRTVVNDEARMYISGGVANEVTVSQGLLYVSSGGVAQGATIYNEGIAYISSGGTATAAVIHRNGRMYVSNGGLVSDAVVSSGGRLEVQSGGTAVGATLLSGTSNSGGILSVSSGGTALSTVVSNGGRLLVREGLVSGAVVSSGGSFTISSGGTFTGTLTLGSQAVVSAASGGVVQFDLTKTSAGAAVFVNDISLVKGVPKYVLTVKDSQSTGKYDLAAGADGFNKTISVVNGSTGTELGVLPVGGGTQTLGGVKYTLIETNDLLSVIVGDVAAVDKVKPTVTGVKADVTTQTNGDVTVTAVFSDDIEVATSRYKLGDGAWQDYPYGGVVVSENTTVYFQATDLGGNKSDIASIEIKNIDKVKPTITVTPSTTEPAESVTVKAQFADNVAIQTAQKRVGNGAWSDYAGAVTVTENTTVYFKAVDTAGNETTESYQVTNIGNDDPPGPGPGPSGVVAKSDIDGNGFSDVMFVWTGTEEQPGNYQHGYWMNGTNTWQSAGSNHPAEWDNLGCYDMTGDGKADSVLFGNVTSEAGIHGAYIGYYADANDLPDGSTWVNIGYLTNEDNIDWKNAVGNLTGNASNVSSIVWYAPELYALGVWTDGTENWVELSNQFGGDAWTLVGCGDFDGDGKDQVVMALNGGEVYYTVGIDGTSSELAKSDSGWAVRAIGDFAGDGKDDIVAFHAETGLVAMWGDGDSSKWSQLGQLDAKDWFVVGCGDYDGDAKDDLLVRQYSTGMLGYYTSGNMDDWNVLGYGVDMNWTVIA